MSTALRILSAGPAVSLQDAGRRGYLRFGVTEAGAMDPLAFATANVAAKGPGRGGETAIEVSLGGLEVTAEGAPIPLALAGGDFDLRLDDQPLPPAVRLELAVGARLRVRPGKSGAWCYLAVAGRIDVPPVLGSNATHARSALGGIGGRALAAGDRLTVREVAPRGLPPEALVVPWLERPGEVIRVLPGPQHDYFSADEIARFCAGPWSLSPRSDRMAYLLDGPRLTHARGFNIISDGIVMGAIQVPGDGRPIVLMADRQVTGGYTKIATVIGADLGRLAQRLAGRPFRFEIVGREVAVAARAAERARLERPVPGVPLVRTSFSSELLLGTNLIAGVTSGADEAN